MGKETLEGTEVIKLNIEKRNGINDRPFSRIDRRFLNRTMSRRIRLSLP